MTHPAFSLFRSHLRLAHFFVTTFFQTRGKGTYQALDATMGNGHDTLFLASMLFPKTPSSIIAIDIDDQALTTTKKRLMEGGFSQELSDRHIVLEKRCHTLLPDGEFDLIMYNLGYLPGSGNKLKTTMTDSTLKSIQMASERVTAGGVIFITCYPGHDEGKRELQALHAFFSPERFSKNVWSISFHHWIQTENAPCLFVLQRALPPVS